MFGPARHNLNMNADGFLLDGAARYRGRIAPFGCAVKGERRPCTVAQAPLRGKMPFEPNEREGSQIVLPSHSYPTI